MTELNAAIAAFRPEKVPADEIPAAHLPKRRRLVVILCSVYAAVILAAALVIPLLHLPFVERAKPAHMRIMKHSAACIPTMQDIGCGGSAEAVQHNRFIIAAKSSG
ncbi:MAG: hypothetical protein LBH00_01805 [Planctomycetaceae bacterium]|nr:hypothetical protein [Planctomycetaceae bacterium]